MLAYPQRAEEILEILALRTVVVRVEHTQEYALAEPAWTDEKEVARLLLQFRDKHRLVHVIQILFHHVGEICHTIRYLFYLLFHIFLLK